ncbi:hypothetical protein [Pseudoduganella sp. OTU4001]|uniref:hypothetical protein n=1 Tax=Pseudoduganella sp. OTU4001 TaxID=3043854 RepID=UPI00313BD4DE
MEQQSEELRLLRQSVDKLLERQRETDHVLFGLRSDMERDFMWVKFWQGMAIVILFVLYICLLALLSR